MTDSLFDDNQNDNSDFDGNKDFLAELTGPGGKFDRAKYQSDEDMYKALAKGKYEADFFIQNKNRQFDALREDYLKLREEHNAGPKLQEMLDQLKQQLASRDDTMNSNEVNEKPSVSVEDFDSLFNSRYEEKENKRREQSNFKLVTDKMKERYGDNFQSVIKQQADSLGLSKEFVNNLAKTQPNAFLRMFVQDSRSDTSFQAPPDNSQRTGFVPSTPKRTWEYYEKLRKENPRLWSDPKTQTQMLKDYQDLGSEFENGTFKI